MLVLAALLPGRAASGQDARGKPGGERPAEGPTRAVIGSKFCANCHEHPENYRADLDAGRLLCRMAEYPVWDKQDKHKDAWKVLAEPRATRMGELLGIGDVTRSDSCVSCHGVVKPAEILTQSYNDPMAEGVTCVACHGAYQPWVLRHQIPRDPQWRKLTRREKQRDFGMTDLWNPVTRAEKCASCHVGDAREGKVVTHAMYAAGHPPLPGIEVATFSDAQPRHWQYLAEKSPEIKKALGVDEGRLEQTELVAVGGLVPLRASLRLFVAQARGDGLATEPPTAWPDFARFDCAACHHDLPSPGWLGWRQRRGFDADPGRPPLPGWPAALVRLGIEAAHPGGAAQVEKEFDRKWRALRVANGARPFGDKAAAVRAADDLIAWSDGVLNDLEKTKVDRPTALRLLRKLGEIAQERTPDYDAARELAWAFRAIYREVEPVAKAPAALEELDRRLLLTLPSAGTQAAIVETLDARLRAAAEYDPKAFRERFAELVRALPAE